MDSTRRNAQDESTPLVGGEGSRGDFPQATDARAQPRRRIAYYMVVLLLIPISFSVAEASQIQFFESVICKSFYKNHDLSAAPYSASIEKPCKDKAVQAAIVHILSWQPVFNFVASTFKLSF